MVDNLVLQICADDAAADGNLQIQVFPFQFFYIGIQFPALQISLQGYAIPLSLCLGTSGQIAGIPGVYDMHPAVPFTVAHDSSSIKVGINRDVVIFSLHPFFFIRPVSDGKGHLIFRSKNFRRYMILAQKREQFSCRSLPVPIRFRWSIPFRSRIFYAFYVREEKNFAILSKNIVAG